ncbi:MAG: magnesium chelatase subunit D family protein [Methanobacteriaceae archaeon]|nr:magnesium chelatase subunit D family protein [Methanobacteriaceae archaeon]
MHHKFVIFPFTAMVGQELLKKALLINAIDSSAGGVLIKGDKGTGKSTFVRSLSYLLPPIKAVEGCSFNCHPADLMLMCHACQKEYEEKRKLPLVDKRMEIVDMPISATEDMVIGTIDIKKVLKDGIKALEPGILARANRNILYIDEVNLLDDHLVNVLLDSAAMGVNLVEREGISIHHPARFILVGTMNPEEGELRPQILDRFGLSVEVRALESKEERLKIMQYRREFDEDPWKFEKKFEKDQEKLQKDIIQAQELLPQVEVSLKMLEKMVEITTSLGIKTHRADIFLEKTSRVLAALGGRKKVNEDDIKEAALMALPHRMKQLPFQKDEPLTQETIENLMQGESPEEVFEIDRSRQLKKDVTRQEAMGALQGKNSSKVTGNRGMYLKARDSKKPTNVAVDATVRKAARENGQSSQIVVLPEHVMEKVRVSKGEALYIILLDSSSSMRMDKKIGFAKSLSWLLLKESYEKKNRVALMSFRGDEAEILSAPTSDVHRIEASLEKLPTGGKTPLTPAIYQALEMAKNEKKATPAIIVISDGRGNIFLDENLETDVKLLSGMIEGINMVFVNAESRNRSIGVLEDISSSFAAPHFYLDEVVSKT